MMYFIVVIVIQVILIFVIAIFYYCIAIIYFIVIVNNLSLYIQRQIPAVRVTGANFPALFVCSASKMQSATEKCQEAHM
jgi:hypothetical protein